MITAQQYELFAQSLPLLRRADAELVRRFRQEAFYARLPAGRDVFAEGDDVEAIALLASGVVRVFKIGETGREITLYRFGLGESCILTANAILSRQSFPAIALVEQEAEAAMIPADAFRDWIRRYDLWRDFFFNLLSQRLAIMMSIVDEVAFRRMDSRIAVLLLDRCRAANPIVITHQEIAAELGSSREVVSRILEDFTSQGFIATSRGAIEVRDVPGLQARAAV
ncbi:MAG TPA: Crp/Fnr family transcriptional regulator [Anaerolineaceae bacterium]|nr:Crp/Fnr family transcriptional regulator [Anaerolineaceae bacterium]